GAIGKGDGPLHKAVQPEDADQVGGRQTGRTGDGELPDGPLPRQPGGTSTGGSHGQDPQQIRHARGHQGNLSITGNNMLLNLHSHYSLRYGTYSIRQLIEGMKQNGYDTAVLTDINNSTASLDFIRECRAAGLTGLAGMEYRSGDRLLYIGIAKNERGFKELNDFMTMASRKNRPLPASAPEFNEVFVVYPYGQYGGDLRDNEYLGVEPSDVNRFRMDRTVSPERCV